MEEELLVGRWAVCRDGRIGRIEGQKRLPWGESWVGTGLDGRPWASRQPLLISAADVTILVRAAVAVANS